MSKAVVDPGELRRFAHDLKRFNNEVRGQISSMHTRLMELGQSWRDQEHSKFVDEYEQTMKTLVRFLDHSDKHIPFLIRKAERVEDYLQQR